MSLRPDTIAPGIRFPWGKDSKEESTSARTGQTFPGPNIHQRICAEAMQDIPFPAGADFAIFCMNRIESTGQIDPVNEPFSNCGSHRS